MNKKVFAVILFITLLCSFIPVSINNFHIVKAEDEGPNDQWIDSQCIATDAEIGLANCGVSDVIVFPNGTVWCVFEARHASSDFAETDLFRVISYDNGSTWGNPELWIDADDYNPNTLSEPEMWWNGSRLWLVFNPRDGTDGGDADTWYNKIYMRYSDGPDYEDDATWTEILVHDYSNESLKLGGHRYVILGSDTSIITSSGRTLVPGFSAYQASSYFSFALLAYCNGSGTSPSDWHIANIVKNETETMSYNENGLVELENGTIYSLMRTQPVGSSGNSDKAYAYSDDGGLTWSQPNDVFGRDIYRAKQSVARVTTTDEYNKSRIVMIYNNCTNSPRRYLSAAISYDEGTTASYQYSRQIQGSTYCMYPSVDVLGNKSIIVVYSYDAWDKVYCSRFNIEWVSSGTDWLVEAEDTGTEFINIEGQTNGTTISTSNPTINWTIQSNTSMYQLQIDNNLDFSSPEVDINNINTYNHPINCSINTTRVSFTLPNTNKLTSYGTYYMRVRAFAKEGT